MKQPSSEREVARCCGQWVRTLGKNEGVFQRKGLMPPKESRRQWPPSLSEESHLAMSCFPLFSELARAAFW